MSIRTLTPPAAEPLALDDAKIFLRVTGPQEDALIGALIAAARERVEALTGKALVTRRVAERREGWPSGGVVRLGLAPVSEVHAVRAIDSGGVAIELDASRWRADLIADPPRVVLTGSVPVTAGRAFQAIEVEYSAGYGESGEAAPASLRQAMRDLTEHFYERGGRDGAPLSVRAALAPFADARL